MTKLLPTDIGTKVTHKYDGRTGTVIGRELAVSSLPRPGVYGQTIVTVRYDSGGFDATGDLGWFRSSFKATNKLAHGVQSDDDPGAK